MALKITVRYLHRLKRTLLIMGVMFFAINVFAQLNFNHRAKWICAKDMRDTKKNNCPIFSKTFNIVRQVSQANMLITAHGIYQLTINGESVGNGYFTPGFTSYKKRLQYQIYNFNKLIKKGRNNIR